MRVQSRTSHLARRAAAARRLRRRRAPASSPGAAARQSAPRRGTGLRVVQVHQREAAVVFVVAGLEGAGHGELLEARHHAGRRDLPAGGDGATLSPVRTPGCAQSRPAPRQPPGLRAVHLRAQLRGQGVTFASSAGEMPHHACRASPSPMTPVPARRRRRRADHLRVACACPAGLPVGQRGVAGMHLDVRDHRACGRAPPSGKPFITDSTMISAATPSAMPAIDTAGDERDEAVAPAVARPRG